jgi:hypothetical protein
MSILAYSTVLAAAAGLLIKYKDDIKLYYAQFGELQELSRSQHKGRIKIFYATAELAIKYMYYGDNKKSGDNVLKLGKNKFEVTYVVNGETYKMVVMPRKGPRHIQSVTDQSGEDVTDMVAVYAGPCEDFHGLDVTPGLLNKTCLVFECADGIAKTFTECQIIKGLN